MTGDGTPSRMESLNVPISDGAEGSSHQDNEVIQRGRKLTDESSVWQHNSWDDVEWSKERAAEAETIIATQLANSPHISTLEAVESIVQGPAALQWDRFYTAHSRWFFKDRLWLRSEFAELYDQDLGSRILEVGCGAGNTIFPLARARDDEALRIYACDFAPTAVQLVQEFREFDRQRMTVFLHDLALDESFLDIPEGSLDIIVAIFVLSALDPGRLPFVFCKLARFLRPGGLVLFRDYGRYDMTQLRFKAHRLIRPDLYVRGDGTAVHYFAEEEVTGLAQEAGFEVVEMKTDRRLLVNRFRKLTMYRVWVQAKFRKLHS